MSTEASQPGGRVGAATLRSVGKRKLLTGFLQLVQNDRGTTAAMLTYIGEIDRRRLYLEDAYSSMFAMCTRHFGMSESIAGKRIRASRAARRFPRILDMIRSGELHLSGVHQLASYLTEDNCDEVLDRAKHRSMREIDELIAEISPERDRETVLREIALERPDGKGDNAMRSTAAVLASGTFASNHLKNLTVPISPRRYRLHVTIGHEAKSALDELTDMLSHQVPTGDPAIIVEKALALLLAETKRKRTASVKKPRRSSGKASDAEQTVRRNESEPANKSGERTRAIPAHVRRAVFERDRGRCAFIDDDGRRCGSAWQVELHHCVPFGRDGPHTVENIALRCRAHNQYEAELEFGKAFMERRRSTA